MDLETIFSLDLTPVQEALRDEMRAFFKLRLSPELAQRVRCGGHLSKEDHVGWQKELAAKRWLAQSWPRKYGGCEWGPVERLLFDLESNRACAPKAPVGSLDLLAPVLIEFGSEDQKSRHLPGILQADTWWCQGFSEPGAGSDLASLSTRAVWDGDSYVINGTKLWTSNAQDADWMFCLVRTSQESRKQEGISFLVFPMDTPGISVSPIITLGGLHHVNQVTLEDVRVPLSSLVGREGQGWEIAKFLLARERFVGAWIGKSFSLMHRIDSLSTHAFRNGRLLTDDPRFRDRYAELQMDMMALFETTKSVIRDELAGKPPGPSVSLLKLKGSELQQALTLVLRDMASQAAIADPMTLPVDPASIVSAEHAYASQTYFDRRALTIYGGSAEIQRNIIAHRMLNL